MQDKRWFVPVTERTPGFWDAYHHWRRTGQHVADNGIVPQPAAVSGRVFLISSAGKRYLGTVRYA